MPQSDGLLESRDLCSSSVIERILSDEAVTSIKIAKTIQSDNFVTGSAGWQINRDTGVAEFQDVTVRGTINADDIVAGTLSIARIAAGSITATEILNGTITATQIANGTITTTEIAANTITAGDIASGTITASEIAANTITASEIAASTITTSQIAANTILAGDIASGAVTATEILNGTITATEISNGTITTTQIAANTITASDIASGTITASEIASNTITATEIASSTITASQIAAGTITASRLSITSLDAITATMGTLTVNDDLTVSTGNLFSGSTSTHHLTIGATAGPRFIGWRNGATSRATIGVGTGTYPVLSMSAHSGGTVPTTQTMFEMSAGSAPGKGYLDLYVGLRSMSSQTYWWGPSGSASAPGFGFVNDPDTGMYRYGANSLGFSAGGLVGAWSQTGLYVNVGVGNALIRNSTGSISSPTYTFGGDTDTGMYRGSANQIVLTCGSVNELYLSNTQFVVPNVYNDAIAGSANVVVATNGRLRRATSAKKYKTDIRNIDLADVTLRPVIFTDRREHSSHIGFIADDLAGQDFRLGVYGDGDLEDYDTRAILAVMASKINRLEEQVAA